MSRAQFGFLVGFGSATVWATTSFLVMIGVVVAGLLGFGVARILDGRVNVAAWVDRLSAGRR